MSSITAAQVQDLLVRMDTLDDSSSREEFQKDVKSLLESLKETLDHPLTAGEWPFWLEPFQLVHHAVHVVKSETGDKGRRPMKLNRSHHTYESPSKPRLRKGQSSASLASLTSLGDEGSWREPPKRPKPTKSEHDAAVGAFRTAFNKLSKSNFEKISSTLVAMHMPTKAAFDEAVTLVFDKALKERFFQRLYARLACVLGQKKGGWCEIVFDERPDGSVWWALAKDPSKDDESKDDDQFEGPYKSRAEAEAEAFKTVDFRRALLGHCQRSFMAGSTPDRHAYFSTITFIGELFVEGMAPLAIIYICLDALMDTSTSLEEDQVEAFCALLTTVGASLKDPDSKDKNVLPACLELLKTWSKTKALAGRIRFGCMDVLDLAKANWVPKATLAAKTCVS